ncbi:MAG: carboxypeptidase regulatory-like domain-containing protein, partial [Acidobacteriota bacterium]|nr:carboxypeptidase regulatory-like domain-containing protein [Acidobacteriota bacterium]
MKRMQPSFPLKTTAASIRVIVVLAALMSLFTSSFAFAGEHEEPSFGLTPVTLVDLPDVAECRGMIHQELVERVRGAAEDPEEAFEKWRREKRTMMEESPIVECQSKLWKALKRQQSALLGTNHATVPEGTGGLSLRPSDREIAATFGIGSLAASVGSNANPAGGVEGYQGEVQIAVNPNNPLQLVAGANTFYRDPDAACQSPTGGTAGTYGTQALYGSSDGGVTWTYRCAPWPAALTGGVSGASAWFGSDPAVAWDAQGRAYAVYMLISQNSAGTSSGSSLVIARSTDSGQNWTNLGIIVNNLNVSTPFHDKQFMAIDNSAGPASTKSHPGRIYVIWDADNVERVAYSDNGTSWTTVILPTPSVGSYDIGGDIKVGPDGTVYSIWNRLVYTASTQTSERTVFSKSVDGGATWSTPVVIATQALTSFGSNNKPPAQESRGINAFGSLGLDNNPSSAYFGYLYFVYPDFPAGTTTGTNINIYLVRSTNGGTSWSTPLKVNDDVGTATQIFPWLAVDPTDGSVNVSWYDTRIDTTNNRKTQLFYARSSNGGISFEPNILVTDNGGVVWRNSVDYSDENATDNASRNGNQYGDYTGIIAHNRRVVPFWTDTRSFFPTADTVSPTRREDAAAAVIINCSAPSAVAAPTVSVDPSCSTPSVAISWSANAVWGTNATGGKYSVYRSTTATFPTGSSPIVSNLSTTNYTDTTGVVGTTYYYFVTTTNDCPGTALTPMSANSSASASVVFPACGQTFGTMSGTVQTNGGLAISGASITAGARSTTTDGTGAYSITGVATGSYTVTAAATGYVSSVANNVVVADGQNTVRNFALTVQSASACATDTTQADFTAGTATSLDLNSAAGDVKLALSGSEAIDQQNTSLGSSGNGVTTTTWEGQTFTAAASGSLTRLDVAMFCSSCTGTTPNVTVEIRTVSANLPTTTVLATATITGFSSGSSVYYTATFGTPATIVAGTQYAYVVRMAANPSAGTYATTRSTNNAYANGAWVQSTTSGASWTTPGQDLGFKVYITPQTFQTSGNLVSSVKDSGAVAGASITWGTLSWTASTPANTTVRFHAAASSSAAGPFNFVGPDGTASTFFTTSGAALTQFNGFRYLKYKAYLSTTANTATPVLSDVTACSSVGEPCTPPATPAASNGGPYCAGSTVSLSTPDVTGATYAWTGPNGFTSTLRNPTIPNATTAASGTYSVTITVSNCTSAAGSTIVAVNAIPSTPVASNGGPYCENGTIALSTPAVTGATYAWTGPNGFTSASRTPTLAATLANAGSYSVTVTVNSCTSSAGSTTVVVNATPATPVASNGGPYCENGTIALSTPAVSGATYSWTGPNGFTSTSRTPTRTATLANAGSYSVTVTVNNCTSAAGSTTVVVNAAPATPVASNDGPYCENGTISLSTPDVTGATYAWTGPNGFTSSSRTPTLAATLANAGTYSVTVTVNSCTSNAGSTNVVVNAIPATPVASNGGPYCENGTIALSTPLVTGATYAWTGPNGFTSSDQNPSIPNGAAGTYSVTVTVNGCTSPAGNTTVVV